MSYKVRYDRAGNIVISLGGDMLPSTESAEGGRVERPLDKTLRVLLEERVHALSQKLRNIRLPKPKVTLPKFTLPKVSFPKIALSEIPQLRFAWNALSFGARFTAIFLFLFLSLNAVSYFHVGRAWLLPDVDKRERRALQVMTDPLLSIPELPMAGRRSRKEDMSASLDVAPPDNRLIIPKIGKNVPLISATSAALKREDWKTFEADIQDALLLGVVRYPGTAEPGELGNVFITGHSSNYPWIFSKYNAVLARLPTLEIGDEYSVYYEGKLHRYRIAKKFEVSPKDVSVLEQPRDRYMSTLMTCVPIGTTLRRLVLQADEVNPLSSQLLRPGA